MISVGVEKFVEKNYSFGLRFRNVVEAVSARRFVFFSKIQPPFRRAVTVYPQGVSLPGFPHESELLMVSGTEFAVALSLRGVYLLIITMPSEETIMKITSILAAGILVAAAPMGVLANEKHDKDLVKALNLKGDRAEQVEDIMSRYDDQAKQIKERAKDQISDLRDQKKEQLKAVLSDKEFEQYESMKEAKKEKMEKWAEKCEKHEDKWFSME